MNYFEVKGKSYYKKNLSKRWNVATIGVLSRIVNILYTRIEYGKQKVVFFKTIRTTQLEYSILESTLINYGASINNLVGRNKKILLIYRIITAININV